MADIEENAVFAVDTRDAIILALFGMAYRSYTLASHNFMCVANFPSLMHGNIAMLLILMLLILMIYVETHI